MKKPYLLLIALLASATLTKAQTTDKTITEHDLAVRTKDSLIIVNLIDPVCKAANGQQPNWETLQNTITQKHNAQTADRAITKAIIYFNY